MRYAGLIKDDFTAAPGVCVSVFVQGCPHRCPGCFNPETWDFEGGKDTSFEKILNAIDENPLLAGVTFSGGEPTSQAKELIPLIDRLHEEGINVCVDTNGGVWNPAVEELFKKVDLALLDIKQINPARHESLTGRNNSTTLATAKWLEENGKPFCGYECGYDASGNESDNQPFANVSNHVNHSITQGSCHSFAETAF